MFVCIVEKLDVLVDIGFCLFICFIGIVFGEVIYGNVGFCERFDFIVIGSVVNVVV